MKNLVVLSRLFLHKLINITKQLTQWHLVWGICHYNFESKKRYFILYLCMKSLGWFFKIILSQKSYGKTEWDTQINTRWHASLPSCILIFNLTPQFLYVKRTRKPHKTVRPDCKANSKTLTQRLNKMMTPDGRTSSSISRNCFAIWPPKNLFSVSSKTIYQVDSITSLWRNIKIIEIFLTWTMQPYKHILSSPHFVLTTWKTL